MLDLLKKHFGYEQFRPLQKDIIDHCLSGKDALVLMPTGGGKSMCYQLPALKFPGLTIVISPLIALMKDQVDGLTENGIPAAYLNSSLAPRDVERIEAMAYRGQIKLLYLAPERLANPTTQQFLKSLNVSLFAIDEAHCISEWGHDFRPDYRTLNKLRTLFPAVPIIALTATANPRVRDDIVKQLQLQNGKIFRTSFLRPNLTYRIIRKLKAFNRLIKELRARPNQSIIIYCFSRKATEQLAEDLRENGMKAVAYHAGLSPQTRSKIQDQFIRDEVSIITATVAFGMGIDKPDVRLVVHMDLPKSVEGYYQETGRAGRDGLPSDCLLFYSAGDRIKHEYFIRQVSDPAEKARTQQQLDNITRYCEQKTCRIASLLAYFGEPWDKPSCNACDICLPQEAEVESTTSQTTTTDYDKDLFEILRATRRELAQAQGVPPYIIFGDRTLHAMATTYPQNLTNLATIFGVGKEKLSRYGERFLQDITTYATTKGIADKTTLTPKQQTPRTEAKNESVRHALSQTVLDTLELIQAKQSISEAAKNRRFAPSTIVDHLEQALDYGKHIDLSHLIHPDPSRFETITTAFTKANTQKLAPVRAILGENYSYDELRFVRLLLKAKEQQSSSNSFLNLI